MTESIFFRLLKEDDKGPALCGCIADVREGREVDLAHVVRQETFALLPGSPMAYWVSDAMRRKFKELPPFEGKGGTVQRGLFTTNDFRFVRAWWEVDPASIGASNKWANLTKGLILPWVALWLYYQILSVH